MNIFLILISVSLPHSETYTYETNDKGKIGNMIIETWFDSLGYHAIYKWEDRVQQILFDADDMSTLHVQKTIGEKLDYEIIRKKDIRVYFQGRRTTYYDKDPVYDRHALEYALRGFEYSSDFSQIIKLHVPEFMIINARISIDGRENVLTHFGDTECWKVKMSPRVLFLKWSFYFWIEVEYPHRFIRYSDSSGKNTISLIEYTDHSE